MPRLRPATPDDALRLYVWRCRAEQAPWYEGKQTAWQIHHLWFTRRLNDPLVRILIWETEDGAALGAIRLDSNGELSYYTDDPEHAADMLKAATVYADEYGGRLKITLDVDDDDTLEALAAAGFRAYPARSLVYTA